MNVDITDLKDGPFESGRECCDYLGPDLLAGI